MSKVTIYSIALSVLTIVLTSCGDDEKGTKSQFNFKGKNYSLTGGFAEFDGIYTAGTDKYYYWILILASSGITVDDDIQGTGDAVIIEIRAKNDDSFVPAGSYEFDDDLAYAYGVFINYNAETGVGSSYTDVTDISIEVTKSSNTYTINFTLTLGDGSVAQGTYIGTLVEV